MKKLISFVLLLVMMVTLVACDTTKTEDGAETKQTLIDYGKKYLFEEADEYQYYVFEENQTGYCVVHYTYESSVSSEYNYTQSGRVDFVWREASNGAVYLFETKTTYNEDHTEGHKLGVISGQIYFAEEFFAYSYDTQYGTSTVHYIKEGSALAESLKK